MSEKTYSLKITNIDGSTHIYDTYEMSMTAQEIVDTLLKYNNQTITIVIESKEE